MEHGKGINQIWVYIRAFTTVINYGSPKIVGFFLTGFLLCVGSAVI